MKRLILVFIIFCVLWFIGFVLYQINYRPNTASADQNDPCWIACDKQMRQANITDIGCVCGTELDLLKKLYPKKYRERIKRNESKRVH